MEINESILEFAATISDAEKTEYNDKYILKQLMEGKSRDELALELNHKNYRTIDMYMRRRGYVWNSEKQIYISKPNSTTTIDYNCPNSGKVQRIISLFSKGLEPSEIAKKVNMKDHRAMAIYMKSKGYIWSSEEQNYTLQKGEINLEEDNYLEENELTSNNIEDFKYMENTSISSNPSMDKLQNLLPMLEMINKNKEKLAELLSINSSSTIPRYVVGGITITKSLCMSHPLAELIKEFSNEKNISQREIFEIAIIEFLKKYGYESEINTLFS